MTANRINHAFMPAYRALTVLDLQFGLSHVTWRPQTPTNDFEISIALQIFKLGFHGNRKTYGDNSQINRAVYCRKWKALQTSLLENGEVTGDHLFHFVLTNLFFKTSILRDVYKTELHEAKLGWVENISEWLEVICVGKGTVNCSILKGAGTNSTGRSDE